MSTDAQRCQSLVTRILEVWLPDARTCVVTSQHLMYALIFLVIVLSCVASYPSYLC